MSEKQRIGIVGDGQLGRMMAEANLTVGLGYDITALGTAGPKSPAAQIRGVRQMDGALTDGDAIRQLAEATDVVTWEIEHINAEALIALEDEGYDIQPSPRSLQTIQDKYEQKEHFRAHGLPVARYDGPLSEFILPDFRFRYGNKLMVKTAKGGFDGRGNFVLEPEMSWPELQVAFGLQGSVANNLYVEQMVSFQRELAVIGVRERAGRMAMYPVVETVHQNNICHTVFAPADISPRMQVEAEELGRAAIETFDGAGVFAVELFQDENDDMIINEIAPRVHNSGHWTIEGAETSQFENHLRAIMGLEAGPTGMMAPAAVMVNILGAHTIDQILDVSDVRTTKNVYVHSYGKTLKPARKVGHITALGNNMHELERQARDVLKQLEARI